MFLHVAAGGRMFVPLERVQQGKGLSLVSGVSRTWKRTYLGSKERFISTSELELIRLIGSHRGELFSS